MKTGARAARKRRTHLHHPRDGLLGGLRVDVREAHAQREHVLDLVRVRVGVKVRVRVRANQG